MAIMLVGCHDQHVPNLAKVPRFGEDLFTGAFIDTTRVIEDIFLSGVIIIHVDLVIWNRFNLSV